MYKVVSTQVHETITFIEQNMQLDCMITCIRVVHCCA